MRGYVPAYTLERPASLADALARLADGARPFAGGTDLMVLLEAGKLAHKNYVSVRDLAELKGIAVTDTQVTLGASTTYAEVLAHRLLGEEFPSLLAAARETGARAIQNRGTLGGNIANGSPAADSPPALLVADAELVLVSAKGERSLPYAAFHTGYKQMQLASDELIKAIRLPRRRGGSGTIDSGTIASGTIDYYRKVGTRRAQAISKVCLAARFERRAGVFLNVRIALGSVAPVPLRCLATEQALEGKTAAAIGGARAVLAAEISPLDDIRSTRDYRLGVAGNLLEECFGHARLARAAD